MLHTAAFFEATAAAVTNSQINALQDGVISIRNNNFFPVRNYQLLAAMVMGASLTNARLDSATIRQISELNIFPLNLAAIPGAEPRVQDYSNDPMPVAMDEELELQVTDTAVGGENITGAMILQVEYRPTPPGRIYTIRATSTGAAVANAWTNVALTYDNNLPRGRYAVVGGVHISTNGQAFRLNLEQQKPLPGGFSNVSIGDQCFRKQRMGGLGSWGEFDNTALPELEVLCNAADAVHTLFLDFVKVG